MTTPKIYNNIDEVLKLYPKIYYENDRSKNKKLEKFSDELYVSPNCFASIWQQSYKAAYDTLHYLTHLSPFGIKFYVAVFETGKLKHFVKFIQEPEETVEEYYRTKGSGSKAFKYLSNILDKKVKFSFKEIQALKTTKFELMNCILQSKPESDEKHAYHNLLEDISKGSGIFGFKNHILPDGMYIYSLRDTLLVRKDGNHPFINFAGGLKSLNKMCKTSAPGTGGSKSVDFQFVCNVPDKMIPIFNTTGGVDYYDIPIVEYESLIYIKEKFYKYKNKYEFVNKDFSTKIPKAIFRGSATGCGYDEENVRLHLAKVGSEASKDHRSPEQSSKDHRSPEQSSKDHRSPEQSSKDHRSPEQSSKNEELSNDDFLKNHLDIGITGGRRKFIYNSQGKIGVLDLDAYLEKYDIKRGEFMDKPTQSNYKYILIAEGNVAAHRIASDLLLNSVILLIDSMYTVWCSHLLKPYVHYIPIKADLSDLEKQLQYCEAHPEEMKAIAHEARKLGEKLLTPKSLEINIVDSLRFV
jgi:hypothetical protein